MIPRHLRYSPVNGMIITWGVGVQSFSSCGLPQPVRNSAGQNVYVEDECCHHEQIQPSLTWADWGRWLPEVGIGINDFEEEVAAAYVREAAIKFTTEAKVLQRSVFIELQQGVLAYPLEPYENERIVGILAVIDGDNRLRTGGAKVEDRLGAVMQHGTNTALLRPEIVECACRRGGRGIVELLVWSAPTEDACLHDKLLYDQYRSVITAHARALYATVYHYENRPLMGSVQPAAIFDQEIRRARGKATAWIASSQPKTRRGRLFGGR